MTETSGKAPGPHSHAGPTALPHKKTAARQSKYKSKQPLPESKLAKPASFNALPQHWQSFRPCHSAAAESSKAKARAPKSYG